MGIDKAIRMLEKSNKELKEILEDVDVTLEGMRSNPRFEGIIEDLEKLFNAYLKTWIKSNTEILDVLKKDWR